MAHCMRCNSILDDYEVNICNACVSESEGIDELTEKYDNLWDELTEEIGNELMKKVTTLINLENKLAKLEDR